MRTWPPAFGCWTRPPPKGAELVVMPEFCNHLSVYDDQDHCRSVAVSLDGPWLGALARRSAEHGVYTSLTVTVPRGPATG